MDLKRGSCVQKADYAINIPHVFTDLSKAKCQTSSCYGALTLRVSFNTTVRDDAPVCTQSVDADAYALFTLYVCVRVNVTVKV